MGNKLSGPKKVFRFSRPAPCTSSVSCCDCVYKGWALDFLDLTIWYLEWTSRYHFGRRKILTKRRKRPSKVWFWLQSERGTFWVPSFEIEHDTEGGKRLSCKIEREDIRREWFDLTGVEYLLHLVLMQRLSTPKFKTTTAKLIDAQLHSFWKTFFRGIYYFLNF